MYVVVAVALAPFTIKIERSVAALQHSKSYAGTGCLRNDITTSTKYFKNNSKISAINFYGIMLASSGIQYNYRFAGV